MRVLVAEDDEDLRRLLAAVLRSWGYDPTLVPDGARADEVLGGENRPTLAILDWMMPGLDGIQVVKRARARTANRGLRVIILTARDQPADTLAALEAGADDYVPKPFSFADLRGRLDRLRDENVAVPLVELAAGMVLGSRWRLESAIGRGGMGEIWRARHTELGHLAALKTILTERATSPLLRARFEVEARAIARLRSPYIAQTYDYGTTQDGRPFLVMEFVGGASLAQTVDESGPAPVSIVAMVIAQIARALAHAHEHGIVHRDVKPGNIVLETDGDDSLAGVPLRAKLIDFGIAQLVKRTGPRVTTDGMIVGTPGYSSPEQLRGAPTGPSADVWALGAVAYFMATGSSPFQGRDRASSRRATLEEAFPAPSALVPALAGAFDAWIARACAHDADARFGTATEASHALRGVARDAAHRGLEYWPRRASDASATNAEHTPSTPRNTGSGNTGPLTR